MTKNLAIFFVLFTILHLNIKSAYTKSPSEIKNKSLITSKFDLSGDVLYRLDPAGRIRLYDKVGAVSVDGDILYYIRSSEGKWIAGFLKENSDAGIEFDVPGKYDKLYKFEVSNNIFYYLADTVKENPVEKIENNPVFVRFNPDQQTCRSVDGVRDFSVIDGKSIILRNNFLDYNGLQIPLALTGKLKISEIIDSRMAVVSGEEGTEIVDLIAEKSIYQYKNKSVLEYPDEYNIVFEFTDNIAKRDVPADVEDSIYYEVLIDGVEENRTETGPGGLVKVFYSKLSTGRYHIIKPERWELDKTKGRYARMNNVYQPAELKIYIPENRILKIKMEFNGTGYGINQSVMFE
ncbi:MAG TPA: hypothetical protein PKG60_08570 [Spirochaetota bacterium]|nr:hypothetical protein [Spirochaetota bacterium]HPS86113.1 hypothetical protein [Spirochaetota bacterium]